MPTRIHTHTNTQTFTHTRAYQYTQHYKSSHANTHTLTHMREHTHIYLHTHIYIHTYTRTQLVPEKPQRKALTLNRELTPPLNNGNMNKISDELITGLL